MKKTLFIVVAAALIVGALSATVFAFAKRIIKECVLADYVSEIRYDTFTYSDDDIAIKANFIEREQPLKCDGIRGELGKIVELEVCFTHNPQEATASFLDVSGELNYQSVENKFTMTCSHEAVEEKSFKIDIVTPTKTYSYTLNSVIDGEILSPLAAIECVREYDASIFASLMDDTTFLGEIFVRIIFDEECYYYVGICDRNGSINAYLLNATTGKVIATKTT